VADIAERNGAGGEGRGLGGGIGPGRVRRRQQCQQAGEHAFHGGEWIQQRRVSWNGQFFLAAARL
jgi:hypothetical protein